MRFYTHLAFSIVFFIFLAYFSFIPSTIITFIIFILASWIPDLDETSSKQGKKVKPLAWIIHLLFGHRGVFHSLWIPAIGLFLIPVYGITFALGYLSHLILDALTPHGIPIFYPADYKLKGPIKTGSVWEIFLFTGLIFFMVYYGIRHYVLPLF